MKTKNLKEAFGRNIRAVTLAVMALVLTVTGTLFPAGGTAHADVGNNIHHTYLYVNETPGSGLQSDYYTFIRNFRIAAGHSFRNGVYQAQTGETDGLIALHIKRGLIEDLTLWITPRDLYVRGFTTSYGLLYQFNDEDYNLITHLTRLGYQPRSGWQNLSFGSNYNSLSQAAGRGRERMPISFADFSGSWSQLANSKNIMYERQATARSLMLMIQFTSEAARFNDVFGIMSDIMQSYNSYYPGLPMLQQRLENSWYAISDFGTRITQNPSTPPRWIEGVGTLYSWYDVQRYLGIMLGLFTLYQEGPTGDWSHTEL